MPSIAVNVVVVDTVLKELEATTKTLKPIYSRTYDNERNLKDSGVLHIDVAYVGYKIEVLSRVSKSRDPIVQVVVRKKLNNETRDADQSELDRLGLLVEEIEDHFFLRRLDDIEAVWMNCETFGPLNADYRQYRQFTAIIQLTFRVHGSL